MNVKIEGLDRLVAAYKKAPQIVEGAFRKAIGKAIIGLEASAKPITPIDTGFLRNSVASSMFLSQLGGQVINTAPYASFVHEGTPAWPLSIPPKNPNTVRQFFLKAVEMTEVARDDLWKKAASEVAAALAK